MMPICTGGRGGLPLLALVLVSLAACTTKPVNTTVTPVNPDRKDAAADGPGRDPDYTPPGDGGAAEGPTCPPPPATLKSAGEGCTCDNECTTGFCQDGSCCSGAACGKRPPGSPCSSPDHCDSGFCADGVCCNVACGGACVSCNQGDRMGECVPVPAGVPDPHGACRQDSPESCGQSGLCNGQGGCAKHPAGTTCKAGVCQGTRTVLSGAECDGEGTCVMAAALDCAPFTCEAGACRSSCADNGQCTAPALCTNGSCGARGRGQDCTSGDQCGSGFCVDGVCCDTACTGKCQFCASPATRGTCTPVRADAPDPRAAAGVTDPARICVDQGPSSCGTDGRCDGRGGCQQYREGTTCRSARCDTAANTETAAGVCRGGSCQVPNARSCAPFRGCSGSRCVSQCGSDSQCASPNTCQDGSCGKKPVGALCSRDSECAAPGICAQGRCCASACNGTCMACNVEGSLGTRTPVPARGTDPTGSCRDDACNNGCNGMGGCLRERTGASCRDATCSGTTLTRFTCGASGTCDATPEACPAGQMCMANRCVPPAKKGNGETCASGAECQSSSCVGGRCCAGPCTGACRACTAATSWTCQDRPNGTECGNGNVCQGGACTRKPAGAMCGDNMECQSGSCLNGRCCAERCAGTCRTCNAGTMWRCGPVADGTSCGGGQVCRNGACQSPCPDNQTMCGTMCVDLRTNPSHCGECRNACPSGRCVGGSCAGACPDGEVVCPPRRQCVNLQNNRNNCGQCNRACPLLQVCRMGNCVPRVGGGGPDPVEP